MPFVNRLYCGARCQHNCGTGCKVAQLLVKSAESDGRPVGYCQSYAQNISPCVLEKSSEPESLYCGADCVHNCDGRCTAKRVLMKQLPFSVACDTFESYAAQGS